MSGLGIYFSSFNVFARLSQLWGTCFHDLCPWPDPHLGGQFGEVHWDNSTNASDIIGPIRLWDSVTDQKHQPKLQTYACNRGLLFFARFLKISLHCSPDEIAVMGWNRDLVTPPGFSQHTLQINSGYMPGLVYGSRISFLIKFLLFRWFEPSFLGEAYLRPLHLVHYLTPLPRLGETIWGDTL